MTTTPEGPAANFDRIARPYRWLEYMTLGRSLERCRTHFLAELKGCRVALVLGDGDGRFTSRLMTENAHIHVDAVDQSAEMLRLLTRGVRAAGRQAEMRLRTHRGDALEFQPLAEYDLVVTHFFLDCLTQTQADTLCRRVAQSTPGDKLWLISDFQEPSGFMRWPARLVIRALYAAFRVVTGLRVQSLPDHRAALASAGLLPRARQTSLAGLLTTEIWEYTAEMVTDRPTKTHPAADPLPDPEPAVPSLPAPDPGVFHHEPGVRPKDDPKS